MVITVYKRYKYIKDAINSVLSQTEPPDQIIIVADNPKMLGNMQSATLIEADYPQLGRKIYEAIMALRDDIDRYRARIRNHGHSCFLCEIVIRSQFHTTYEPEA
jgi:Glycosyl transferase family 2.